MFRRWLITVLFSIAVTAPCLPVKSAFVSLPSPKKAGGMSIEATLAARRSIRDYTRQPLTIGEVSQLLWAAQGVTSPHGKRTAASAMHRYPLEVAVVVQDVEGLPSGAYHYVPAKHALEILTSAKSGADILAGVTSQPQVHSAPAVFVIAVVYERMGSGVRNRTWTDYEAGLASENLLLEAASLNLGAVVTGGVDPELVKKAIKFSGNEQVLVVIPIGHPTK